MKILSQSIVAMLCAEATQWVYSQTNNSFMVAYFGGIFALGAVILTGEFYDHLKQKS